MRDENKPAPLSEQNRHDKPTNQPGKGVSNRKCFGAFLVMDRRDVNKDRANRSEDPPNARNPIRSANAMVRNNRHSKPGDGNM